MNLLKARLKILFFGFLLLTSVLIFVTSIQHSGNKRALIIGAKNCTEQHILGEMLALLIENHTDLKVIRSFNLEGTTICFNALKSGAIDAYIEYTGTALLDILKEPLSKSSLYEYVKQKFEERFGLMWLDPLGFSNQYVLITRPDTSLRKISDLMSHPSFHISFDPEFSSRLEMDLLKKAYPMAWNTTLMDQVLLYFSLINKGADVISGFSTDGRLLDARFLILEDDRHILPRYDAAPVISKKCLQRYPEVYAVFALLKNRITEEKMRALNYQVEMEKRDIRDVVHQFLKNAKLLP